MRIISMFALSTILVVASALAGEDSPRNSPPQGGGGNGGPAEKASGTNGGGVGRSIDATSLGGAVGKLEAGKKSIK